MRPELAAVILAGGRSQRMGRDKALLPVQGQPLLHRQIHLIRSLGIQDLCLCLQADTPSRNVNLPILLDDPPGIGPLGALLAAWKWNPKPFLLVLAVDLPALTPEHLHLWIEKLRPACGVIPQSPQGLEPLAAIYPKACQPLHQEAASTGRFSLQTVASLALQRGLLQAIPLLGEDAKALTNWNSPQDWTPPEP